MHALEVVSGPVFYFQGTAAAEHMLIQCTVSLVHIAYFMSSHGEQEGLGSYPLVQD